jgi:cytochrome c oxidase subunit II
VRVTLHRSAGGLVAAALACGLAGCGRDFSATSPAGPQAERISDLTWLLPWLGTVVYALVVGFMLYALWRARRRDAIAEGPEVERRMTRWTVGAVGVTTLILLFLLVTNFTTGRALAEFADPSALNIRVVGHQWWWEVQYQDPVPGRRVTTANEIHIPVGRRVRVDVTSRDVIHSFWVPNLHGKIDLIPGYNGSTTIQADRPGVFRGRCAEFCGLQHAHMDFLVIAEPADSFANWYEAQLESAAPPADTVQQAGQQVFLSGGCALCHTVRGTPAGSRVGPDLTHLASRRTIAAGTLPNTRGHLGGWVVDPQKIKPGARMPPNSLSSTELQSLLSYLENLR